MSQATSIVIPPKGENFVTLNKVLWACLTGTIGIILMMVTAWAKDNSTRIAALEVRANTAEQHFVAIQHDYQDLRERLQEIREMLIYARGSLPVVVSGPQQVKK